MSKMMPYAWHALSLGTLGYVLVQLFVYHNVEGPWPLFYISFLMFFEGKNVGTKVLIFFSAWYFNAVNFPGNARMFADKEYLWWGALTVVILLVLYDRYKVYTAPPPKKKR